MTTRREPRVVVESDADAAAARAAELLREATARALDARDAATVAVSGGSTPAPMLARLGAAALPWSRICLLQVDERVAPAGSTARNLTGLLDALDSSGALGSVRPMPVEADDLDAAARAYGRLLAEVAPDGLDAVHLGLGDDAHTASWPPGDPVVDATIPVAVVGPYQGHTRLTLTPAAVGTARAIVVLVTGAGKADALGRLLEGDPTAPAARIPRDDRTVVVADAAAHGRQVTRPPSRGCAPHTPNPDR